LVQVSLDFALGSPRAAVPDERAKHRCPVCRRLNFAAGGSTDREVSCLHRHLSYLVNADSSDEEWVIDRDLSVV
jgi:hypothetical protein